MLLPNHGLLFPNHDEHNYLDKDNILFIMLYFKSNNDISNTLTVERTTITSFTYIIDKIFFHPLLININYLYYESNSVSMSFTFILLTSYMHQ